MSDPVPLNKNGSPAGGPRSGETQPISKHKEHSPAPTSVRKSTGAQKLQHANVEIFVVLGVVLEALWHRPVRPLREMFHTPQLPQRDMYQYRLFVNLLWYAKNYLWLMMGWMTLFGIAYPLILLNLVFFMVLRALNHRLYLFGKKERALKKKDRQKTPVMEVSTPPMGLTEIVSDASPEPSQLDVHLKAHQGYFAKQAERVTKARSKGTSNQESEGRPPPLNLGEADIPHSSATAHTKAAAKIREDAAFTTLLSHGVKLLQLLCCIAVFRSYGLLAPILVTVVPVMAIAAHSALTPYGDESASLFESTMSTTGGVFDAPATPVLSFEPTSFTATRERFERQRDTPHTEAEGKIDNSSDGRASPAQQPQGTSSPSQAALERAMAASATSPIPFGSNNGFGRGQGRLQPGQRRATVSSMASAPRDTSARLGPNRGTSLQNIEELADAMSYLGGSRRTAQQRQVRPVTKV